MLLFFQHTWIFLQDGNMLFFWVAACFAVLFFFFFFCPVVVRNMPRFWDQPPWLDPTFHWRWRVSDWRIWRPETVFLFSCPDRSPDRKKKAASKVTIIFIPKSKNGLQPCQLLSYQWNIPRNVFVTCLGSCSHACKSVFVETNFLSRLTVSFFSYVISILMHALNEGIFSSSLCLFPWATWRNHSNTSLTEALGMLAPEFHNPWEAGGLRSIIC